MKVWYESRTMWIFKNSEQDAEGENKVFLRTPVSMKLHDMACLLFSFRFLQKFIIGAERNQPSAATEAVFWWGC